MTTLLPLLHAVVAMGAEGMQVVQVPKQRLVALVGLNVIDVLGGRATAGEGAGRVRPLELDPERLQPALIAALPGGRAVLIVATVPGASAGDLARAALAMGDNPATGAKIRDFRHGSCS